MPTEPHLEAAGDGKGPRWVGDDLPSLPPELQHAQDLPPKVTDKYVFFFGYDGPEEECCLQQWYPSVLVETENAPWEDRQLPSGGREFHTSEQYMMFHKAILMGDMEVADDILGAKSPAEAKKLGRKVRGFKQEIWDKWCDSVVERGQVLKFGQDEKLKQVLLNTGSREIVETSPNDRLWGIGYNTEQAEDHVQEWGENKLGKALMRAREKLR